MNEATERLILEALEMLLDQAGFHSMSEDIGIAWRELDESSRDAGRKIRGLDRQGED